jgi:trehalose-6-phosphate hydrolase
VALLAGHAQIAAYLRVWQDQRLLVLCNFSGAPQRCVLPDGLGLCDARLLLGNWPEAVPTDPADVGRDVALRPWEARIILARAA